MVTKNNKRDMLLSLIFSGVACINFDVAHVVAAYLFCVHPPV